MTDIALRFGDRIYRVTADMRLVCGIEDELGSLAALLRGFAEGGWRVGDLVALVQMMLQSAGRTVDFMTLGNKMMEDGLADYVAMARRFLAMALDSK